MERKCGKCRGEGGHYRNKPKGSYLGLFGSSRDWIRCDVCNGSGNNPKYREKSCERCWRTIGYSSDAQFPPKYCSGCKPLAAAEKQRERESQRSSHQSTYRPQQQRQDDKWREKSCTGLKGENGCSTRSTIRYRTDWNKVPDLCPSCIAKIKAKKAENEAMWKQKSCPGYKGRYCGNTIKYRVDWNKVPDLCPTCITLAKADRDAAKLKWREKPCLTSSCTNIVKYNVDWEHPPNFCPTCKEKRKNQKTNRDSGSIPGFQSRTWENNRGDIGKVMSDDNDPGYETHLHHHPDGTTISTYKDGEPIGRFNLDTGEDETR